MTLEGVGRCQEWKEGNSHPTQWNRKKSILWKKKKKLPNESNSFNEEKKVRVKKSIAFQVLAIMNKTAINIHVYAFCVDMFSTSLGKYKGAKFFYHMVRVCSLL